MCVPQVFFCIIGKSSELSYDIKSPPGRIALRRKGKMSPGRPAAGGESAKGRILIQSIPLVSFTEGHVFDMIQGKFINKFRKIHKKTEDIPLNARIKSTKLIIWTKGDKGWTG